MKTWKTWLFVILCCGAFGAWGLIGCGDDESRCEAACNKINDCEALWVTGTDSVEQCKNKCLDNFDGVTCILDCDEGQSCDDYGQCVADSCNPPS